MAESEYCQWSLSEIILIYCTYALWGKRKEIGCTLGLLFIVAWIILSIYLAKFLRSMEFVPIGDISPKLEGCFVTKIENILYICWTVALAYETTIMDFTFMKVWQNSDDSCPGTVSYMTLLVSSIANVLVLLLGPPGYTFLLAGTQHTLHVILSSRIVLNIRRKALSGVVVGSYHEDIELKEIQLDSSASPLYCHAVSQPANKMNPCAIRVTRVSSQKNVLEPSAAEAAVATPGEIRICISCQCPGRDARAARNHSTSTMPVYSLLVHKLQRMSWVLCTVFTKHILSKILRIALIKSSVATSSEAVELDEISNVTEQRNGLTNIQRRFTRAPDMIENTYEIRYFRPLTNEINAVPSEPCEPWLGCIPLPRTRSATRAGTVPPTLRVAKYAQESPARDRRFALGIIKSRRNERPCQTAGMDTEVANQIVSALQQNVFLTHLGFSANALMSFDYFITFPDEIELVWRSRWTIVKVIFLLNRYIALSDVGISTYGVLGSHLSSSECSVLYTSHGWMIAVSISLSETILAFRTYALWGESKRIAYTLGSLAVIGLIVIGFALNKALHSLEFTPVSSISPELRGCFVAGVNNAWYIFIWSITLASETIIMIISKTASTSGRLSAYAPTLDFR
ncbi:hypothetical protein EVG20_g11010, partial [Dentipellis fragilis]